MYNSQGSLELTNCLLNDNTAYRGGGIFSDESSLTVSNCTFAGNWATDNGSTLACDSQDQLHPSVVDMSNCIIRDATDGIWNNDGSAITVTYSDVQGGFGPGPGNIDDDPGFVGFEKVSYWKFDEDSGSTADDSADSNPGTITGATWTSGKVNSALYFHGGGQWASSSDRVTIPHSANLDITGPFTVQAWIKAGAGGTYRTIVDKYNSNGTVAKGFTLYLSTGRLRLSIYSYPNGGSNVSGISDLRDNTWHHVAGVWDGSYAKVYVDGLPKGQTPGSYPPASTTAALGIGKRLGGWGGYNPFLGTIDEVAIDDRALDADEIKQHYQNGLAGLRYPYNYRLSRDSLCIDAGSNAAVAADIADLDGNTNTVEPIPFDLDGFPRFIDDCAPDTGSGTPPVVDMGAYEFLRSDIISDGNVNFLDFCWFALHWPDIACGTCSGADLTCDGNVDFDDLKLLAQNWLAGKWF